MLSLDLWRSCSILLALARFFAVFLIFELLSHALGRSRSRLLASFLSSSLSLSLFLFCFFVTSCLFLFSLSLSFFLSLATPLACPAACAHMQLYPSAFVCAFQRMQVVTEHMMMLKQQEKSEHMGG